LAKKKKSKSVKKASKSRGSKKKATSSGSGNKAAASKKTSAKSSKKKTTKKKTTQKKTPARKKTTKSKKSASASAKSAGSSKSASGGAKAASKSAAPKPANQGAAKSASPKTASVKPASLSGPVPTAHNGEPVEWTAAKLRKVKTGLTRKDYNYFLALLLEKRAEIMGDVAGLEAARRAQDGDISHVPLHMADVGSDNYEQEFTLGLMESERKLVRDIDEAIGRIQDRTYGVCIESGQPIPRERLEIKPWARYTIDVARERERRGLAV